MSEGTVVAAVAGFSLLFYSETTGIVTLFQKQHFSFCLLALAGEGVRKEVTETHEREREREREREDLFVQAIASHEGVQVDDLPPHSTY